MPSQTLGLSHFWAQADGITQLVAFLLLAMSVASWFVMLSKFWASFKLRAAPQWVDNFWQAPSLADGAARLQAQDSSGLFSALAQAATRSGNAHHAANVANVTSVGVSSDKARTLRSGVARSVTRLESGLTVLASVGSTAPFVGLFGTVWGIYHALVGISGAGQVMIDKVAGPVGEALIMTAAGLAVAIPAVLAYNALTRSNRVVLAELEGFARDLLNHR